MKKTTLVCILVVATLAAIEFVPRLINRSNEDFDEDTGELYENPYASFEVKINGEKCIITTEWTEDDVEQTFGEPIKKYTNVIGSAKGTRHYVVWEYQKYSKEGNPFYITKINFEKGFVSSAQSM